VKDVVKALKQQTKNLMIWLLACILLIVVFLPVILKRLFAELAAFQDPQMLQAWLNGFGSWSYIVLFLCVVSKVLLPMLPSKVLEMTAGFCFGFPIAFVLVLCANAVGTWLVRLLVNRFGQKIVCKWMDRDTLTQFPLWQKERRFAWIVFLTYFIPGTPKDALTYAISLSNMNTWKLVAITTAARMFTVAFGVAQGCALEAGDYVTMGILLALFALLSCPGLLFYRRYIIKKQQDDHA